MAIFGNIVINHICENCNNEFELINEFPSNEKFTVTMPKCPHCDFRNDLWIEGHQKNSSMSEFEIGDIAIVHESCISSKPKCEILEYDGRDNSYLVKTIKTKNTFWINVDKLLKL